MHHYIPSPIKPLSESSRSAADLSLSEALVKTEEEEKRKAKKKEKYASTREKTTKRKETNSSSRSNTPITSIIPSRHPPNPLLPATLQIPLRVEILVVHVALEVRRRTSVIAKQALHIQELARRLLVADLLAGLVGLALLRDVVGQGFGGSGVHVGAAGFGAPDGSVSGSREGDSGSLDFGGSGGYGDCDEGGGDGDGDCDAVDVFGGGGWGEAFVGGCGGCDEGGDVDC
jgi:hypothetical protein